MKKLLLFLILTSSSLSALEIGDQFIAFRAGSTSNGNIWHENDVYEIVDYNANASKIYLVDGSGTVGPFWLSISRLNSYFLEYGTHTQLLETFSFASGISLFLIFSKGLQNPFI